MKKTKPISALLLAAAMLLSLLAGCAGTPSQPAVDNSTPPTVQPNEPVNPYPDALVIAEQGMFSAGGTVLTSDGTFDVSN